MSSVLEKYFNPDAIELAWHRVQCWPDKMVKDKPGIRAFGYKLKDNCQELSMRIIEGKYEPQRGFKFYMPKPSKTLRTLTLLFIEDAIVYQTIANKIAENNYFTLEAHKSFVFGSVLSNEVIKGESIFKEQEPNFFFFKFWKNLYQQFTQSVIQSIEVDKAKYKFETDITGFFDSIPHYNLLEKLSIEFGIEDEILDLLSDCFNVWSGTVLGKTPGVGIPQGPIPSFFIANLLLYKLDEMLIDDGHMYYRYMDDIHIYGFEESELEKALLMIDIYTKSLALSINSKKTSIEPVNKESTRLEELKQIIKFSIYSGEDLEVIDEVVDKFKELKEKVIELSDQDSKAAELDMNSEIKFLKEESEIKAFWRSRIKDVEEELPDLFVNPKSRSWNLILKDNVKDIDAIALSQKFGSAFKALQEYKPEIKPNIRLLKFWLFLFGNYYWRANNFFFTLILYKNSDVLKEALFSFAVTNFKYYEWVRYYCYMILSISQEFNSKECKLILQFTDKENSDLAKIALYRLLIKHANNSQFQDSIAIKLRKEKNEYLKFVIADFMKNNNNEDVNMYEFIQKIGL